MSLPTFLLFRGKAQPNDVATSAWHPVAYHCLDVAACVGAILTARRQTLRRATDLFALSAWDTKQLLLTVAALHDIGKFSEAFFGQDSALWPEDLGPYETKYPRKPHTSAGYALWRDRIRGQLASRITTGDEFDIEPLIAAAFGHHGTPLKRVQKGAGEYFATPLGRTAAEAFADDVVALLCDRPLPIPEYWEATASAASWWVAGMISIADWLGSNQRWFPYREPSLDLASYWKYARQRAEIAVGEAGLIAPRPRQAITFGQLTSSMKEATPAQRWALELELPAKPVLFILEDVTGAGKTETAHILVHRFLAAGRASGAYWAMPTQATANAMWERQREMIAGLFDPSSGRLPSVILSHGQAKHHAAFRDTVLDHCAPPRAALEERADDQNGTPSTIACASFLADNRRAGLLADVGAGTIDQALLAVLPSKFNTIRLFGLAEKVLVLDEVHAYDAYMREEIATLLRFHAALGGSAIVLSATLPAAMRRSLVKAWQMGCSEAGNRTAVSRVDSSDEDQRAAYPMATVVDGMAPPVHREIEAASWSTRSVPVRFLHDTADVIDRICAANERREAVAWIRNTVDSCLEAAKQLRERGIEPIVFHARFAQCDRQAREAEVVASFGRDSRSPARARVLVATQVVEQSLDLDFDMLVTDLAPVDLIIQRAGRLWRHAWRHPERPTGSEMVLLILSPQFDEEPAPSWLDALLPKMKYVYEDVGVLWRTLKTLHHSPSIDTPDGIRPLVEAVYAGAECPSTLTAADTRADGKAKGQAATARNFVLTFGDGYCGDYSANWYSDIRVPTRLIDEQTVIRLGRVNDTGAIVPWKREDSDDWRAWALSEVRVSRSKIRAGATVAPQHQSGTSQVKTGWPEYEKHILLVPFEPAADGWTARVVCDEAEVLLAYSEGEGLLL